MTAVLYDARTIHVQWLSADYHFFQAYLFENCSEAVYEFRSSFALNASKNSVPQQAENMIDRTNENDGGRCYNSIYDCLYILSLGTYAQILFSAFLSFIFLEYSKFIEHQALDVTLFILMLI